MESRGRGPEREHLEEGYASRTDQSEVIKHMNRQSVLVLGSVAQSCLTLP